MPTPLHIVSLGCARNEVDAEELAARFSAAGFVLVPEPGQAEVVVVNTCGFIEAAKAESIDEILNAATPGESGRRPVVVATGCLAERYGRELADWLPEADAVIGFDGYDQIAATMRRVMDGDRVASHQPGDRRRLLPVTPVRRTTSLDPAKLGPWLPGQRTRLDTSASAALKIASGCDRRCAFCAIPAFRGSLVSRPPADIVAEARWLVGQGVREVFLVSENTTSYGKDLGLSGGLEGLLGDLSGVDGLDWIRLSYLQPAEVKPSLIEAIATTAKVVPYLDLPFQHAAAPVLRRMRRFGDADAFLALLAQVRQALPEAGVRSNVIVGFPGETEADVEVLTNFLGEAGLDAVGVFGYSDEEGTEAAGLDGHLDPATIQARVDHLASWADTVTALRAGERVGQRVEVLVEPGGADECAGRAAQQGPEDGRTTLLPIVGRDWPLPGQMVRGRIDHTEGVDWWLTDWTVIEDPMINHVPPSEHPHRPSSDPISRDGHPVHPQDMGSESVNT